jgi:hypothetical protein
MERRRADRQDVNEDRGQVLRPGDQQVGELVETGDDGDDTEHQPERVPNGRRHLLRCLFHFSTSFFIEIRQSWK